MLSGLHLPRAVFMSMLPLEFEPTGCTDQASGRPPQQHAQRLARPISLPWHGKDAKRDLGVLEGIN